MTPSKKNTSFGIKLVALLLFAVGVIAFYSLSSHDKPGSFSDQKVREKNLIEFDETIFLTPIKEHLEALKKGNNKLAYEGYTTEEFQKTTSFKEFNNFILSFPVFTNFKEVNYHKLSFNNNIGMYEVWLTAANGEIYDVKYDLSKENGKWKIIQIEISDEPTRP